MQKETFAQQIIFWEVFILAESYFTHTCSRGDNKLKIRKYIDSSKYSEKRAAGEAEEIYLRQSGEASRATEMGVI